MRAAILSGPMLILVLLAASARPAGAELIPYEATIRLDVSAGQATLGTPVVDAVFTGVADVSGGTVKIAAGDLSTAVSTPSGFGGVLVNGALTLSVGGAGGGAPCPLSSIQERCIPGGGFGGVMALSGVTQLGQGLSAWGDDRIEAGMTSSGLTRIVQGTRWTTGRAEAWFYVPEIDPTPFLMSDVGSFVGLPSTHTGTGLPGFRVVTPMVVTGSAVSSLPNARGTARLTIRFLPRSVPLRGWLLLAAVMAALGFFQLRARASR